MEKKELIHSGGILGAIDDVVDALKHDTKDMLWLGAGAAAGIAGTDFLMSKIAVRNGVPIIPVNWAPAAGAVVGMLAGSYVGRKVNKDLGYGIMAGTAGLALSAYLGKFLSPGVSATTAAASASEEAGTPGQTSGFGFGRAFSGASLGNLGRYALPHGRRELLYGVGTPNMAAAGAFDGATVAIEEQGQMAGANVQFEENALAGMFN